MTTHQAEGRPSKAKTIISMIGMIFALLTILAISVALTIRLLDMGDPKETGSLFKILHMGEKTVEADHAARIQLWVLAFVALGLAIASAVLAIAVARTHSLTLVLVMLIVGVCTTIVGFLLVWPLGALAAVIPITALCVLPMSRRQGD